MYTFNPSISFVNVNFMKPIDITDTYYYYVIIVMTKCSLNSYAKNCLDTSINQVFNMHACMYVCVCVWCASGVCVCVHACVRVCIYVAMLSVIN